MKLYKMTTAFLGKDLNKTAILGYLVAESEEQVAEHINHKYCYGEWFGDDQEEKENKKQDIIANKGDFHTEYDGEFYDQKYGWKEVCTVDGEQMLILSQLCITEDPVKESYV